MDPNGTRFHLLSTRRDWLDSCREEHPDGRPAAPGQWTRLEWNEQDSSLRLRADLPLFRRRQGGQPLGLDGRRGAAADRYGNRYWIAADRSGIYWQPSGGRLPAPWWSPEMAPSVATEGFSPISQPAEPPRLAGLAITAHQYLAAGVAGGLLLFDLPKGGPPRFLPFPADLALNPWDLAAAADGGLWVLDRDRRRAYALDRRFRFRAVGETLTETPAFEAPAFRPAEGAADGSPLPYVRHLGLDLAPVAADPIAIEALPDGGALILDHAPAADSSRLLAYRAGGFSEPLPLAEPQSDGGDPIKVRALDFAYDPDLARVYAVDSWGLQAIAFDFGGDSPSLLELRQDFLPLHNHGGRGLMVAREAGAARVLYDLSAPGNADASVRWAGLVALDDENRYEREGVLLSPVFDGKARDCVWDSLFLDACVAPETAVMVQSRVHNDRDLVETVPFRAEPGLYLRSLGAELPFHDPYADRDPRPDHAGTHELLLQRAEGRYLQLRLQLLGNGAASPEIRALRVYYPRYSYSEQYLPAVYREDAESASFLERFLANFRGFHNHIEAHIGEVGSLFDPASAPPEALDWLAGWLGLTLDPLWGELHRQDANPPHADRRRLLIRFAPRLFERRGTPEGIRFALHLLLDPCLEEFIDRLQAAATAEDTALRLALARYGVPYPTPYDGPDAIESLFYRYLLAAERPTQIRLVERYTTRGGRGRVAGDPTAADRPDEGAHRFSVLVPDDLAPEQQAMAERIVRLEKPAHADFDLRAYTEGFRVGTARLGLDTLLGDSGAFRPIALGRHVLSDGYLVPAPPMDEPERILLNRDQLGGLPPL